MRTDPDRQILRDLGRKKEQLRATQDELAEARDVIAEQNRELLELRLASVLLHPEDFDRFIGADTVLDNRGGISWEQVYVRVRKLLDDRPELGWNDDVAEAC